MLNHIIRFALRNRLLTIVAALLLLFTGILTALRMEVDVFPDLNAPTVVVMTEAPGMAPEEVEQQVTFAVETAVNGAPGVRRVRSSSTTGFSVVWVEFDWSTDTYRARQIVSEKLSAIEAAMPEGVGQPVLGPQSSILGEVLFVGLTADTTSLMQLRTLADRVVRPQLLSVGGVAQVAVLGGDVREFQVCLQPDRMRHYGVSLNDVVEATRGMTRNATGGVLYEYGNEYIVRGMTSTTSPETMAQAVVTVDTTGMPVLLGDVAQVRIGTKEPRMGAASVGGKAAVIMTITKQPHAGTIALTKSLDAEMAKIAQSLPKDIEVNTELYRQQRFIDASIDNIRHSLIEGALFVVLILFIFLMNARTTLISLVTIPLSLLITILALNGMGLTVNTMSIGGMAIAIGSLVDDAIVDVENVFRSLRENHRLPLAQRRPIIDVVFDASREVRLPILNSTLIIVVSFVPLFFLSGMEGRMLVPLGIAFIVALFASTLVALTLTPVLCSLLLRPRESTAQRDADRDPWLVEWLKRHYDVALAWAMAHWRSVTAVTGCVLVATLAVYATLGHSFLPAFNEGSFTINVSTMPGISLDESCEVGRRAEQMLMEIPEIQHVARKTGRAELDEHALGVNTSEIEAPFLLADRPKDSLVAEVRRKLATLPGVNVEVGQPISHRIDAILSGTQANIAIKVYGPDLNRLYAIGQAIRKVVADVRGVSDLNVEQQVERPQLCIVPRHEMLARYGITMPAFAQAVNVLLGGEVVSQVLERDGMPTDLTLRVDSTSRATIDRLADLTIDAADGRHVPLSVVAELRSTLGPNTINRENVSRKLVVSANVAGRDLRSTVDEIRQRVADDIVLPEGYRIDYGGQFESEAAASRTLLIASLLSILVIFMLLHNQFNNTVQSLVVLLNLPLALIGGVMALWTTSGEVSIPAIIGFISLFGIATRNGMLLIDRYNTLRASGVDLDQAIRRGSLDRLNPIVMTALTSALALVPLALGGHLPGNEIQSPMAKVILGGLLTSTLLNAFIIPIMYKLINRKSAA